MAWEPVDLRNNEGMKPLVVGIVSIVFATAAVAFRFYSHRIMKSSYVLDDRMIIVALVFALGNTVDHIIGVVYGAIGLHADRVTPGQLDLYSKNLIATIVLWASACSAVKLSLLLLYARVFSIRPFRLAAYAVLPLVFGWWISVFLEELLLCRPLAYNWDKKLTGTCGDLASAYLAAGIINLLTDISVFALPIPMVLKLQLPLRSRIALLFTFCVGLFVCVISVIRIHAVKVYDLEDPTFSMWTIAMWSQLEPTLGIMCACAPFMRPVFKVWGGNYRGPSTARSDTEAIGLVKKSSNSYITSRAGQTTSTTTTTRGGGDYMGGFAGATGKQSISAESIPGEVIQVKRSFTVNSAHESGPSASDGVEATGL